MIQFGLMTKDDFAKLFEGFETSFLQAPFKHPTKSLMRYIPNGFRTDKLKRQQMIKTFTDAIVGNEASITAYVKREIENQFSAAGIFEYVDMHREDDALSGIGISALSNLLWSHGLKEPSFIVLILCGIPCSEEVRKVSKELYDFHFNSMADCKNSAYEEGYLQGVKKQESKFEEEKKKTGQLEKNIGNLTNQKKDLTEALETADQEKEQLLSEAKILSEKLEAITENIELVQKEKTQLENKVQSLEKNLVVKDAEIIELRNYMQIISQKDLEISTLKEQLEQALKRSYSDEILRQICNEAIDELSASTVSKQELLKLTKEKFNNEETVLDGWKILSDESNEIISSIMDDFSEENYMEEHLDKLELLENGILIRYAIEKSLKAILYNGLEQAESDNSISTRFGGEN